MTKQEIIKKIIKIPALTKTEIKTEKAIKALIKTLDAEVEASDL